MVEGASPTSCCGPGYRWNVTTFALETLSMAMGCDDVVAGQDDRRHGPDRRQRPTPMWSRYVLHGGRRRGARRTSERDGAFVDIHGWRI